MAMVLPGQGIGYFVGRVWRGDVGGPSVVVVRDARVVDITCRAFPTMRDLLEQDDPAALVKAADGQELGALADIAAASIEPKDGAGGVHLLAPCDLQAVKACGVTFARSMIERVIEEQAEGDPAPVGWGASIGLHPISKWNNPEPEVVLAVNSRGRVKGATLGNDVNLRDVEGRSALLLSKAKDNNASSAIGPFIRLFDSGFSMNDVRVAELDMTIEGEDGFVLKGHSSMREISRDPLDLVAATIGHHHQYPDGFVLYLGTMFAPVEDRDAPGEGFTHKLGDRVSISTPTLGTLTNTVRLSTECPPWTFGTADLMRNLAKRGLI